MKINKPKFWDKKIGLLSLLMLPLSILLILINEIRKKFTQTRIFNIPVICVGNIYVGGTGKTPASILLSNELLRAGKRPTIIRKYYKDHFDEYNLIKNNSKNLIINKNRVGGLIEAEKLHYNIAILDDGFQDHKIKKKLSIICFNEKQLIGNGLVFPAGPLRERLSSLKRANIVIINGNKNLKFENKLLNINKKLEIYYSSYEPINLDEFRNKKLFVLAGIGNPENFFHLIEENNLKIERKLFFPDHYEFSKEEMQNIIIDAENKGCLVLMTEKDFFRVKDYNLDKLNYLKIKLKILKIEKLISRINSL
jgi:tetraacyldisaccharide 4'-kinase